MKKQISDKHLKTLGWLASGCAIAMFLSYIDQIRLNLAGDQGSILLPVATVINCSLWFAYGFFREKKDLPMLFANIPGIILGFVSFITAL